MSTHSHNFPLLRAYFGQVPKNEKYDLQIESTDRLNSYLSKMTVKEIDTDKILYYYYFNTESFIEKNAYLVKVFPMKASALLLDLDIKEDLIFVADFSTYNNIDLKNQKILM